MQDSVCMLQAAAAVAQAYDLDDLDDEWKALLNELEDRLLQVRLLPVHVSSQQWHSLLLPVVCQMS